jgi:serine-type D-Ala-D-Ala carboxypeptidase/endopeptidase (penicillin-binding protein 4)
MGRRPRGARIAPLLAALCAASLAASLTGTPIEAKVRAAATPAALEDALRRIVESGPLASSKTSVQVFDAETGKSVYSHNADLLLKPASNMKVITSATALALLRPEYRFRTSFYADSAPTPAGVVRGDFYIKGGGSPGLVGEEWWLIARKIRSLGITRIEGDIVGDDTYFDDVRRGPQWPSPSVDSAYNAPVSALSCFYDVVIVTVRPTAQGSPPEVLLDPFGSYFKIDNRAVTSGRGQDLRVGRQWDGHDNIIHVEGRIGTDTGPIAANKCVEEPTLYACSVFREAAGKEGIVVTGGIRRGTVPPGSRLLHVHESKPLADLIQDMNKESNNFMAESILKTIGAETAGPPGTSQKGAAAVLRYLSSLGVKTEGLVIVDGSGLSPENRVSSDALARILLATHGNFQASPEFMTSLPIGGIDGTLDHRMIGSPATRNIRAKTGYINGVSALSGYAWNEHGRLLVFSILVNRIGSSVWDVNRSVDRLCSAMVSSSMRTSSPPSPPPTAEGG